MKSAAHSCRVAGGRGSQYCPPGGSRGPEIAHPAGRAPLDGVAESALWGEVRLKREV